MDPARLMVRRRMCGIAGIMTRDGEPPGNVLDIRIQTTVFVYDDNARELVVRDGRSREVPAHDARTLNVPWRHQWTTPFPCSWITHPPWTSRS